MTSTEATSLRGYQPEGPVPPDRRRECYSWRATGLCRFGNSCRYAHDDNKAYTPPDFQHRQWSHSQASTSEPIYTGDNPTEKFSLMSYNVLADELALDHAKELYKAVPDWCLRWPLRVKKIFGEILHWRPDVICLQEIDQPQDFSDFLGKEGFDWKYAARTGGRPDGCLTLWRRNKFDLVASETIQMSNFSLKDNVGLIVVLRVRPQGSDAPSSSQDLPVIAIANTHLIFNPKRGDIKLGQAGLILRRIGEASQGLAQPPLVIFTGDFNSTPESAIYTFVRDGELDCYTEDRRNLSGQLESDEKGWPPSDIARSRDFELRATLSGMDRKRGTSLDGPSRTCRMQLSVKAGGENQEPVLMSSYPPVPPESASIQIVTSQAKGSMTHSESFPSVAKSAGAQEGRPLQSPRFSGPILSAPGQAPLYPYTDQFGQVAWSYMPPSNADIKRQPFFHEPMRVEEDRPPAPPSPPPGIFRTLSFAQRQINAGTWTTEQLMVATGSRPANGYINSDASVRSQYPRPSPTDVWLAEHPLPLQSAYKTVLGAEPAFTSCHSKFIGTVDYVWFTPEAGPWSLQPTAVLLPPPLESLHCGLPSPEWPSDHISLLANFSIQARQGNHSGAVDPMAELERQSMPAAQHTHILD